jgi:hypothetical protein
MARPLAIVDGKVVELLAKHHCTPQEIAEAVGCAVRTLHRRFGRELRRGRALACLNLCELQYRSAMRGNVRMLIWLGKQWLGQTERGYCMRCDSNGRAGDEGYTIHDNDDIVVDLRRNRDDEQDDEAETTIPEPIPEPIPTDPETERKPTQILPFVTSESEPFGAMVANFR